MKITRKNYEPFFMDYLEGNLDDQLVNEFIDFLQQNPDLKEELDSFEPVSLPDEPVVFEDKSRLLRSDFDEPQVFETAAIALFEGDLPAKEKLNFQEYLSENPQKKKEAKLFESTRLQPDKTVVFEHKSRLRKSSGIRLFLAWSISAAAVLLITLALWNFWPVGLATETDMPIVAENPKPDTTLTTELQFENMPQLAENVATMVEKPQKKEPIVPKKVGGTENRITQKDENKIWAAAERIEPVILSSIASKDVDFLIADKKTTELVFATLPPHSQPDYYEERDLQNKINTQFDFLSLEKIARSGMDLISGITKNDKILYEKNDEGKVTYILVNTKLFGLSAPVNRK